MYVSSGSIAKNSTVPIVCPLPGGFTSHYLPISQRVMAGKTCLRV
jgi:hypothetical protein